MYRYFTEDITAAVSLNVVSTELNAASLEWQKNKPGRVWHWQRAGAHTPKNRCKQSASTFVIIMVHYFAMQHLERF